MKKTVVSVLSCLMLSACGGGGSDANPAGQSSTNNDAAGLYALSSTGLTGSTIVYGDGTFYSIYGVNNAVLGFITGTGTASSGSFTSMNARDYFDGGVLSPSISASYLTKRSISGTATYTNPSRIVPFTGNYDASFETPQTVAALAGAYSGSAASPLGSESVSVTVASTGAFTGRGRSGCTFSGTATPKTGVIGFNVSLVFGGTPCTYPNQPVNGVAISRGAQLVVMVTTANKDGALLFSGTR